ncbi:MAG: ABC transporter permease [Betaproteobacteria bacterium]|nr:ABC transporter permease [Betaproteobacteria bacterium]
MFSFIARRLLATIPVLGVVALVVFGILHLSPGDPAALIAGDHATPQQVAAMRSKLGLDQPLWEQFGAWIWSVLHGELGISIFSNQPVTRLIGQRLEPTIALTITTTIVTVLLAVPIGVIAAWRAGTWIDRSVMSFAVLGFSFPVFVVGYLLIYVVSMTLGWLPIQGYRNLGDGFGPFLIHLVLPSLALGISFMALIARITRTSVLEVLNQDYIRTARSKGLAMWQVLLYHALPNAAVPIVTVIGVGIAVLIGGVVVTESVFAIPGLGRLVVDSILSRDYPVIQGVLLIFAGVYVGINLLIDLLYVALDPRIRY